MPRLRRGAPLQPVATELVHRLRGETEMAHHGNPAFHKMTDHVLVTGHTLDLDRIGPGLDQRPGGRGGGQFALPHGEKRHVRDDEHLRRAATDGCHVRAHHFGRRMNGRREAMGHHGDAVADEDRVRRGFRDDARHQRVVGGEQDDRELFPLRAGEIEDGFHAAGSVFPRRKTGRQAEVDWGAFRMAMKPRGPSREWWMIVSGRDRVRARPREGREESPARKPKLRHRGVRRPTD